MLDHLEVPKMGVFPKMGPQIIPDLTILVLKILVLGIPQLKKPPSQATNPTNPANTNHWLILFMPKLIVIYIYIALSFRQHKNCLQN